LSVQNSEEASTAGPQGGRVTMVFLVERLQISGKAPARISSFRPARCLRRPRFRPGTYGARRPIRARKAQRPRRAWCAGAFWMVHGRAATSSGSEQRNSGISKTRAQHGRARVICKNSPTPAVDCKKLLSTHSGAEPHVQGTPIGPESRRRAHRGRAGFKPGVQDLHGSAGRTARTWFNCVPKGRAQGIFLNFANIVDTAGGFNRLAVRGSATKPENSRSG